MWNNDTMPVNESATFDKFYDREELSFGELPSIELRDYLLQAGLGGKALDLGCGDGRNSLFLADAGLDVTGVDISGVGLEKLTRIAGEKGLSEHIEVVKQDVREFAYLPEEYNLVAAVTVFDHLPGYDVPGLFKKVTSSLKHGGLLYAKVHTVEDPGHTGDIAHASELHEMIQHYFEPNELLRLAIQDYHVIWYREMPEIDRSHGQPHNHAFAKVLARRT